MKLWTFAWGKLYPTVQGLQAVFDQTTTIFANSPLSFDISPLTLLVLSIAFSLKSCIFVTVQEMKSEKVFFPTTSKIIACLWSLFGTLRRVLTMIAFFIPGLGFFSILYHWKSEEIPFRIRLTQASQLQISDEDEIKLFGFTESIKWSDLDRWNYSDPSNPTPPNYSLYTGLTLKEYFYTYFVLLSIHFAAILVVKLCLARDFYNCKNKTNKLVHLLENQNAAYPYLDWDAESSRSSKEDYQKQYR